MQLYYRSVSVGIITKIFTMIKRSLRTNPIRCQKDLQCHGRLSLKNYGIMLPHWKIATHLETKFSLLSLKLSKQIRNCR